MGSRRLSVGCAFTYQAEVATPSIFHVQPGESPVFTVMSEEWSSTPQLRLRSYADLYGNRCTRVVLPMGRSTFRYAAEIDVPDLTEDVDETAREIAPDDLPDDTLIYTLPSRYCLPDVLGTRRRGRCSVHMRPATRGCSYCYDVHSHVTFRYGSSTAWSTAAEINSTRLGVCRDFTHLAISIRRAMKHSGPLRVRLPTRHGRPGRPRADGLRGVDGGLAG